MPPRRIGLMDLAVDPGGFQGDGGLPALERRLRAAGHEVERIRRVRAEAPAGEGAWRADLAGWVRLGGFDLLVLDRCWDAATLDELRAALPGAGRLVRLDGGFEAGLDDRFDAVLDAAGVLALAGGRAPAPVERHQATSRELRERPASAAEAEAPGEAGGRPVLTGPAQGCPFLLDVRTNPRFQGLGLDPARQRTRGCAFCLDGRGGYRPAPEDETVATWLAQLRAARAARPDAREVLLADERPHAHLAAFFTALAREPGLGPVELLVKSRVDWLREDRARLEEACRAAAAAGSVLHLYLVGFESFDQQTLDLFNKGVTVADNRAALALLRELERQHPGAFEFRRHRAHGFVAFHPWTTPGGLLENARVMRQERFHEVRAEAFRTRLRLYPGTPLHALAAAEGLLAAHHPPGRADRAAEQGYQASAPWRFADARVELIWRVADGLHAALPDLGDADLLELSTRWVLRWPALAAAPEAAHLPLLQAIASWGTADAAGLVGAAAGVVDRELARFGAGKRACLKEGVPGEDAPGLVAAYRAMGLAAAVLERHGLDAAGNAHLPGGPLATVAVAADEATLQAVLAWQRRGEVAAMGAVMGYPRCCAEAFAAQPERGDNVENERWTQRRGPGEPLPPPLNRLAGLRLVSHHPCSPACFPSRLLAEEALALLEREDAAAAARVLAELSRGVLFLDHRRAAAVAGGFRGDELALEALEPRRGAAASFPAGAVALRVEPGGVAWRLGDGQVHRQAWPRPLLVVPGQPLHPSALAALGGAAVPSPRWLELRPEPRRNDRPLGTAPGGEGARPVPAELDAALAAGRRAGLAWLALGGGEPTLHRELPGLVRRARRLGYQRVLLRTNGLVLAGPGVARRLAEAGVTAVAFALRGGAAATHDRFSRLPGAFDLLWRGVAAAGDAGLALEGDLLVTRGNAAELPGMVALMASQGVPRLRARLLLDAAGDAAAEEEVVSLPALWPHLEAALAPGLELALPDLPACLLPPSLRRAGARAVDAAASRPPEPGAPVDAASRQVEACATCAARFGCPGPSAALLALPGVDLRPLAW